MNENGMGYRRLEVSVFQLDEIRIHPEMAQRPPRQETLDAAEACLRDTGRLKNLPTVDGTGLLLDGYANYLAAKAAGLRTVKCRVDPDGTSRVIEAVINGETKHWSAGRDLDADALAPGDPIAVIDDGKFRRADFVQFVEIPRGEAIGLPRAVRRWQTDRPRRNQTAKPAETPAKDPVSDEKPADAQPVSSDGTSGSGNAGNPGDTTGDGGAE